MFEANFVARVHYNCSLVMVCLFAVEMLEWQSNSGRKKSKKDTFKRKKFLYKLVDIPVIDLKLSANHRKKFEIESSGPTCNL